MTDANKELIAKERKLAALAAIKARSTTVERWIDPSIDQSAAHLWHARAQAAACLIEAGSRVADIGCHSMVLEQYLPEGCTYVPVDVVKRDARTVVVDLNREPLPRLEVDVTVALGVLEYLHDVPRFLEQCGQCAANGLFSYYPLELSPTKDRLAVGWVNALNSCELVAILRGAGYRQVSIVDYKQQLHFYRVSRKPLDEAAAVAEG